MRIRNKTHMSVLLAVAITCFMTGKALAALGEPAASVAQDGAIATAPRAQSFAARMQQQALAAQSSPFSVTTVQAGKVAIAEYVNAATGSVFAVRWEGPTMPDMRQILNATNFDALRAAVQANPVHGLGAAFEMNLPDLVVQAFGHMGDFTGFAYQPSMLPAGFDVGMLAR